MSKILVTGCAGFIGLHVSRHLVEQGQDVVGLDNLSPYYDVALKQARLGQLAGRRNFSFVKIDLADRDPMAALFREQHFDRVVHLAAQAGVRHSVTHPHAYAGANLVGFLNLLEGCRHAQVEHLVFASSSSVYGANTRLPFSVEDNVDHPVSLYAATKKANELMAHAYAHLYRLPCTGLRFFTVYGPWSRPDMAPFLFTRAILEDRPIEVFHDGKMRRDFTYIDDVVEAVVRVMEKIPQPDPAWNGEHPNPATSSAPYRLYNVGNHDPVEITAFIEALEKKLGKTAQKQFMPLQPGDVPATYADVDDLERDIGFKPQTSIARGISRFVDWYREYYQV
ncbi:MAG TPA: NAD-dependent epimerase [Terriglobia bacterium]|nr:NAD-dependent epimerase [Terriglobia bacterium]